MELEKTVSKKSAFINIPLALFSMLLGPEGSLSQLAAHFGNPRLIPLSIIVGGMMGIVNLKGLVWGIESLLGTSRASSKLVFLSLFRLALIFLTITLLAVLSLINLLGLVIGMTVVFLVLIREALRIAQAQAKN